MDIGELLISIKLNSSAALSSLKTMKQELNDTARNVKPLQQALDNVAKGSSKSAQGFENINNATVTMRDNIKKATTDTEIYEKALDAVFKARSKNGVLVGLQGVAEKYEEIKQKVAATNEDLDKTPKKFDKITQSIQDNASAYRTLAMYATAAFAGIAVAVKKGTDAFNQHKNALVGLKSIAQGTGNSFGQAQKFIEEYTDDGLIPAAEAATALKNLLSRGYTDTQAVEVLERLKDAAAFGRQGSLSLGEAVRSASEGLKNENSILVDNAGVTKNVSKMWEEYAKQIGKTVNDLSQAEKIQAEYNGIMQETRHQVGDAAKLAGELAGTQAAVGKSVTELGVAFGESLAPALNTMLTTLNNVIKFLADFVKEHKTLISVVTIFGATLTGLIAVLSGGAAAIGMVSSALVTLKGAMVGLGIAANINPIILAITGLTAILATSITLWSNYKKAEADAAKQAEETNKIFEKRQEILRKGIIPEQITNYEKESKSLDDYIKKYEEYNAVIDEATEKLSKYNQARMANSDGIMLVSDKERQNIELWNKELSEANKNLADLKKQASDDGIDIETESKLKAQREYNSALKESIKLAKALDTDTAEGQAKDIASKQQSIQVTKNLIETYKTAKQDTSEWIEAEKDLAEMFPEFSTLNGIKIQSIEDSIDATERQNQANWTLFKDTTRQHVAYLEMQKEAQQQIVNGLMGRLVTESDATALNEAYSKLQGINKALDKYNRYNIDDMTELPGTPIRPESYSSSSGKAEKTAYEKAIELYQHRKNLGQLTLKDEVSVLSDIKKLHAKSVEEIMDVDERIYDAKIALQDSILKLSEDELKYKDSNSQRWINMKKRENDLTVREEIEAQERIKARHAKYLADILTNEDITAEKKAEIHDRELNEIDSIEDTIYNLRKDYLKQFEKDNKDTVDTLLSDWERYIKRQKLRNKMDADEEVKQYQGMIQANRDYIKKIENDTNLSEEEKVKLVKEKAREIEDIEDKIYSTKKDMLDKYLDEYYDSLEDEVDAQEDAELKKLKLKKEAIEKYYEDIEKQNKKEERDTTLAELRKKEFLYANAVTKEGLETLADIREEIAKLEAEAEEERLDAEKEAKLDALDAEIEATETKYDTMRTQLESLRKDMEKEVYKLAENIGINLSNAQSAIANRAISIFSDADSSINSFLSNIQSNLRKIEDVQQKLSSGQLSSISNIQESANKVVVPSISGIGNLVGGLFGEALKHMQQQKKDVNVTFNDYGEKIFNSEDDDADYAQELVQAASSIKWGY